MADFYWRFRRDILAFDVWRSVAEGQYWPDEVTGDAISVK